MIVVTGAAGFIGSYIASGLAQDGHEEIIRIDDFSLEEKSSNYAGIPPQQLLDRSNCFPELEKRAAEIRYFIHLGARTDTAEQDWDLFTRLNLSYTQQVWKFCTRHEIPLIYASSAATYGDGSLGFSDDLSRINELQPLNPYGRSKHEFDLWAIKQKNTPPSWAGLKFFNVYGPNEYHKGRMASVIFHAHRQINETGKLRLFRSHKPEYKDGEQKRDFIYVKDLLSVIKFLMQQSGLGDIYNLGSGQARTFNDLAAATFRAMDRTQNLEYFDTPLDIRESYQYFTQADMTKLKKLGYETPFHSLEAGINDYVRNFLKSKKYF